MKDGKIVPSSTSIFAPNIRRTAYLGIEDAIELRARGEATLSNRSTSIIQRPYEQSGVQIAVLVDDYDAPLMQNQSKDDTENTIQELKANIVNVMELRRIPSKHSKWRRFNILLKIYFLNLGCFK